VMAKTKQKPSPRPPRSDFWGSHRPIAIAHRGGDAAGPDKENTIEAFQAAYETGYKYIETDVILTASGELILIHGSANWLQAAASRNITRPVLQMMTLEQIRYTLRPGGAQVPVLEDVLGLFPKMKFILDLKTDEAAEPLAKLINRLKVHDRVCVTGFGYGRNVKFLRAIGPGKVSMGLTVGRGVRFRNINMFLLKSGRLSGVETIFLHHSLVSTPMINLVHHRGFKAVVWTANSSLGIKHAIRSGVDGIISDRVELLKEIVSKSTK